jgi:HNH endonuclease
MSIKEKDIKLLWGRGGNRCALCQRELSSDSFFSSDAFPLGEQAHIVAKEAQGPRGESILTPEERDSYSNLILLCPTHHSLIDKSESDYPPAKLHIIKSSHELWVQSKLAEIIDTEVVGTFSSFPTDKVSERLESASKRLLVWHTWSDYFHLELQESLRKFLNAAHDETSAEEPIARCRILLAHPDKALCAKFRVKTLYRDRPGDRLGNMVRRTASDLERAASENGEVNKKLRDIIEVRLYTSPLVMPLYIIDNRAFVGWYPEGEKSHSSPYLEVDTQRGNLPFKLETAFSKAWQASKWEWDFASKKPKLIEESANTGPQPDGTASAAPRG